MRAMRAMTLGEKVAEVQELQKHGTNQYTATQELDVSNSSAKGTTTRYRIARLRRDHPDIAEALVRRASVQLESWRAWPYQG